MHNKYFNELYTMISEDLLNQVQIKGSGIEGINLKGHLGNPAFLERIKLMEQSQDFTCQTVLTLCRNILDEVAGLSAPEDWLSYIYQYTLGRSFPEAVTINLFDKLNSACIIYLRILRSVCRHQMFLDNGSYQSKYPMLFLSLSEINELEHSDEYKTFVHAFENDYVYELMRLSQDLYGHSTLDHVCGVHYLSLYIGRQLKRAGLPIDLGRVSGAAAGHDTGKYGCRSYELKRVPYLHYYYTDQWFRKFNINYIRHIAINHSTWDLELENLPLESLIIIYSDFRVKSVESKGGRPSMHIYNLDDSFDVILKKLDNVDNTKLKRYKRVYAKLKDFEDYILHIGISVNPDVPPSESNTRETGISYSLMHDQEVVENIKYLAVNHNIKLMYQFRDEYSLENILQLARSQKDWKMLREYIRVFEEYSTYLTQKQKLQMIRFLYDLLIHPEDDIRRHCAELIGALIASYDEDYRKEIPANVTLNTQGGSSPELLDKYVRLFLMPGHKIIPAHRAWIGYSAGIMVSSLFSRSGDKMSTEYKKILLKYYDVEFYRNKEIKLYLLKIAECVPVCKDEDNLHPMLDFILEMARKQNTALRLSALETACRLIPDMDPFGNFICGLKSYLEARILRSSTPAENYIKHKIAASVSLGSELTEKLSEYRRLDRKKTPDIFLSNLKTATDWVVKKVNVDILLENALENPATNSLHTAIHFCNLLKVSAIENVRSHAGESILRLMPSLPLEQRNDVAVELLRALEIEGFRFTEYIPYYLGQMVLYLQPVELDELINDLLDKVKQSKPQVKSLLLKTIGICISNYHGYETRYPERSEINEKRLIKMLGAILNGLGDIDSLVRQVAFSIFGKDIFGSRHLSLDQRYHIFKLTAKKILTLSADNKNEVLQLLANSAVLNHIYRYISDYNFFKGVMNLKYPEKVAFFPGTFDPFTLSHKEIVKTIRDLGFEVYLAVDEFSWSKRTLPSLLRRKIISMSVADEPDIYIFPENIPINLANCDNLETLKRSFPFSEVYIVTGSDVLLNASCYSEKKPSSVYSFPHIIIKRESRYAREKQSRLEKIVSKIDGEIIRLSLPHRLMSISSTQIRGYIDDNRDISSMVDPLVQQYIYEHDFYRREPQEKALPVPLSIDIKEVMDFTPHLMDELILSFPHKRDMVSLRLREFIQKPSARILILRNSENSSLMGFSAVHWVRLGSLYNEFKDSSICEYIRENTTGRIAFIDGIFVDGEKDDERLEQIILTETLAMCLSKDYEYAIYRCMVGSCSQQSIYELLNLQGFEELPFKLDNPIFTVSMSNPCTLNLDLEEVIKEPFRDNPNIKYAAACSRKKLRKAMTKLYPGQLILSFDVNVQHELMIKKICSVNDVPETTIVPRKLGPAMCVPYGNILDRHIIPNTVTKALHTEKLFTPDMKNFSVGAFPHYLSLETQTRIIRSFNRPVILVDDLLHKGHRLRAISPVFEKENIEIRRIIVGILTGHGKELMDLGNMEIDSVYFLPRLKAWFNENSLYPFIGGDALWRGEYPERNLLPSINLILPYTSPKFITGASKSSIFNLSRAAIEGAIEILSAIENEYHSLNERNLSLSTLGAVFKSPRCPDPGRHIEYDLNLNPSHFLKNDLELLDRLENTIV